jgi:putative sugar O-methyltransferase
MKNISVSGVMDYPGVCLKAASDDETFNKFKTISEYTQILEHTSIKFGADYFNVIKRDNPQLLELFDKFKTNDKYGGALPHIYESYEISPSTLRYIKVLSDLIKTFGSLDGFKIAEIGGGYGGQCKIINDAFNIKNYTIIDLPEANALSEKYLNKLNVNNVKYSTSDQLVIEDYDLVISNYAYTKLHRDLQDLYKKKVIDNSSNGYMTCNFIVFNKFPTYSKAELLKLKDNIELIIEEPLTSPKNIITVWKQK